MTEEEIKNTQEYKEFEKAKKDYDDFMTSKGLPNVSELSDTFDPSNRLEQPIGFTVDELMKRGELMKAIDSAQIKLHSKINIKR